MIYNEGKSTATDGLTAVVPTKLQANKEYVFDYQTPAIAYALISPGAMSALIRGWLRLKGEIVQITGVTINPDNGRVQIRAVVQPQPVVQQAAVVNPWVVMAALAAIFSAIGITVSLIYVYEVKQELTGAGPQPGSNQIDPCTQSGVIPYVKCLAKKSAWVAFGVALGALLILVLIISLVGKGALET
jgi:hypothetical protein